MPQNCHKREGESSFRTSDNTTASEKPCQIFDKPWPLAARDDAWNAGNRGSEREWFNATKRGSRQRVQDN
ncbi:hypothetical protein Rcae01_00159 [Novipirellula caenicola]|uniref:Uncharacterized protein n=1 Tax=Novipirellula caenicola TaxID=1536901 RepID=A0ABP9VHM1_9BACT